LNDPEHIPDTSPLRIPFRVNFVMLSLEGWRDVAEAAECPDPDAMPQRIRPVDAIWIAQSYMRLKRRGQDVRLTDRFVPGEVCVALGAMRTSRQPFRSFAIAAQTHLFKARICDCNIVQNRELLERSNEFFMIHWPQPGLIRRDPARGSRIERIGYLGDEALSGQLTDAAFLRQLDKLGMTLVRPEQWYDYHDIDVALAVRNVPPSYTRFKPPSKLINAWAAGCPALVGPEQAFAALRRSPLDYFQVTSPRDVLAALNRLRSEPVLYETMAANGLERMRDFTADAVARRWEELLAGPIAARYRRWLAGPRAWRAARNAVRFAGRIVQNQRAIRAVERFNRELKSTGYDWGKAGGASMPPEPLAAAALS
jgi:hypothetical protein